MTKIFLIILAVALCIYVAVAFLVSSLIRKLVIAARRNLKQEIEKAGQFMKHPVVEDDARDLLARAAEKIERIPEASLFRVKRSLRAVGEARKALLEALVRAHEYRRNHTLTVIGEAERHAELVAEAIRKEFGVEADLAVARSLLDDANRLTAERQYDRAEAKSKLAIAAASAEYARAGAPRR